MADFLADIDQCTKVLQAGGVILYPTDTIWGLGCDATNEAAVEKIFAIKQRPSSKTMIVLMAEQRELLQYVAAPDLQVFQYLESVDKPTTVIYDGIIGLAANLLAADGSTGIRLVREAFCRHLIKRFRKPIVSTSANLSGAITPVHFGDIDPKIIATADYVVKYRQDDQAAASPSSVIRWRNGEIEIIRP